jgi:hypothetical protein
MLQILHSLFANSECIYKFTPKVLQNQLDNWGCVRKAMSSLGRKGHIELSIYFGERCHGRSTQAAKLPT